MVVGLARKVVLRVDRNTVVLGDACSGLHLGLHKRVLKNYCETPHLNLHENFFSDICELSHYLL